MLRAGSALFCSSASQRTAPCSSALCSARATVVVVGDRDASLGHCTCRSYVRLDWTETARRSMSDERYFVFVCALERVLCFVGLPVLTASFACRTMTGPLVQLAPRAPRSPIHCNGPLSLLICHLIVGFLSGFLSSFDRCFDSSAVYRF